MERKRDVGREEYNEYFRKWRAANIEKVRKYNKAYNKKWRKENGYHNEMASKKRYPEKEKARRKLHYEVSVGRVKRQPCEICGKKKAQAHHHDYNKPLDVRWLCPLHHSQVEKRVLELTS